MKYPHRRHEFHDQVVPNKDRKIELLEDHLHQRFGGLKHQHLTEIRLRVL